MRYLENYFGGVDSNTAGARRFAPGTLQQADNVIVDKGELVSRPGLAGLLPVGHSGGAITQVAGYRKSDGVLVLVFAKNGALWRWQVGAGSVSQILNNGSPYAFANSGKNVRFARYGKFLYGIDDSGPLFRVNLETPESSTYTGLNAPTIAPTATLASTLIDHIDSPSRWAPDVLDPLPPATQILNSRFSDSGGSLNHWDALGGNVRILNDAHNETNPAGITKWAEVDQPGDAIRTTDALPNYKKGNLFGVGNTDRYAAHFEVGGHFFFHRTVEEIRFTVVAYSDEVGADEMGRSLVIFSPGPTATARPAALNALSKCLAIASFGRFQTPILSWRLEIEAGTQNERTDEDWGPYVTDVIGRPVCPPNYPQLSGAHVGFEPFFPVLPGVDRAYPAAYLGQMTLSLSMGGTHDFSKYSNIAFGFEENVEIASSGIRARLGFRETSGGVRHLSNLLTLSEDRKSWFVDISTIPPVDRDSVAYLDLVFEDDVYLASGYKSGFDFLFTLGPLTDVGNLSLGRLYTYLFEEADTVAASDLIRSSGSPLSGSVEPNSLYAQTDVVIPASVNTATDAINIYRGGGVFEDGFWRLLATVPTGADASGDGWTWDHGNRTFRDNLPDSDLLSSEVYEVNRDTFPSGMTALCVSNGRLFGAKGGEVWASWLLSTDAESGLYTSNVSDPTDPSLPIKGAHFVLAGINVGGDVVALSPIGSSVVAVRQGGLTNIEGYDPTNFATVDRFGAANVGGIAPCAVTLDPLRGAIFYLSASGVVSYNSDLPENVSRPLDGYLGLGRGASLSASGPYARAALAAHDERLFLLAPASEPVIGESLATVEGTPNPPANTNDVVYVFDYRAGGWVRWTNLPFTSVYSSGDALYFGGADGQLYTLSGDVDTSAPNQAPVPIAIAVRTRYFGADDPTHEKIPGRLFAEVETEEATATLTLSVTGDGAPSVPWTQDYTTRTDGGATDAQVRVSSACRGRHHALGLTASVVSRFRLRSLSLDVAAGGKC